MTVRYATADGTAIAPGDYTPAGGTLTFKPGETAKSIDIAIVGDTTYEADETFTVTLSSPVGATIEAGTGTATIVNDDPVAQPGHYQGTTSQNELFAFDVTSDARVTGLRTGQINQSCDPPDYYISQRGLDFGTYWVLIAKDGTFAIDATYTGKLNTSSGTYDTQTHVLINGSFSGAGASGTLLKTIGFTIGGRSYLCSSGNQTWSATRTG